DATAGTVSVTQSNPWDVITGLAPKTIRFDPNDAWAEVRILGGSGANSFSVNGAGPLRLDPGGTSSLTVGLNTITNLGLIRQIERYSALTVYGGSVISMLGPADQVLVVTQSLFVAASAKLDLRDKSMILNYTSTSPLSTIESQIRSARNGGAWNWYGITSSTAASNSAHNTTLGAMEATSYKSVYGQAALFEGQSISNTCVLVKYTYY